jgi:hypothetical protein
VNSGSEDTDVASSRRAGDDDGAQVHEKQILQNASLQTMMSSSKPSNSDLALVKDGLASCQDSELSLRAVLSQDAPGRT